jgi:thiosulfate/3-mercaptopyruvate sulfurtransferase
MSWKISVVILLVGFLGCKEESLRKDKEGKVKAETSSTSYFIEADELLKLANNSQIKIVDFRKPEIYSEAHIKGALNIWRPDIEDSSYPYGGMMANSEKIEKLFGDLGIANTNTIVIYDDNGLCDASRMWWILQNYDFTEVRLLNGGFNAWKTINGEVSAEIPKIQKTTFKLVENPSMRYYISKESLVTALNGEALILDTRTEDEYSGKRQKKGAAKGGRIPKSVLLDWSNAVNYEGDKKMKSVADLKNIYEPLFPSKEDTIIVYCHSGVRSAHTTFVLTQLLGYKNVKNYDGSWTEWSHFEDLAIVQDSTTTIIN